MEITKDIFSIENDLPVIAMPAYFDALGACDYGYILEKGCILPFYIKHKYIFNYLIFTTGLCGKIVSPEKEKTFLEQAIEYIKAQKIADFILMNHVTALFHAVPAGSKSCKFGSYVLDLSSSEDELFAGLHPKHRNVIKKAVKDGIEIKKGNEYRKICIELVINTLQRQGVVPPSAAFLEKLGDSLGTNLDYWVAADESGKVHGSAILVWNAGHSAYYLFGGSCSQPHTGAMNLLHWEAIREMKKRQVRFYDFVGARINPEPGSKYEGIQRFKARFGGELQCGYLWKTGINPLKYALYTTLTRLRAFVKERRILRDTIDQEASKNEQ